MDKFNIKSCEINGKETTATEEHSDVTLEEKDRKLESLDDAKEDSGNFKVEEGEDERVMKERMELVGSKSPTELGAVTSFSDIPVPNFKSILPERK